MPVPTQKVQAGSRVYLKLQGRFAHLSEARIAKLQAFVDARLKAPGNPVEVPVPSAQT